MVILCLSQNWKFEPDLCGFCMHMLLPELRIRAWFLWFSDVCPKIDNSRLICVVSACICYSQNWKFEPDFYGYLVFVPKLKIRVIYVVSACICYSQNWKFELYGYLMFIPKLKIRAWSVLFLHAYVTLRIENSSLIFYGYLMFVPKLIIRAWSVWFLHAYVTLRIENSSLIFMVILCLSQNWKFEPDLCGFCMHILLLELKNWFLWLSYVCPKIENLSLICVVSACICYSQNWWFEPDFYGYLIYVCSKIENSSDLCGFGMHMLLSEL